MWDDIRQVYSNAGRFARVMPLIFLLPALPELMQHVAEVHLGMYASRAAAKAMAGSGLRLGFGYAKTLALLLPGYWFIRYLAWGDARRAARLERPAAALWLVLFAWNGFLQAWGLFGPSTGALLGFTGRTAVTVVAVGSLAMSVCGVYLTAWGVAWPLGNARIGPLQSAKLMVGSFWRTLGYLAACVLPLFVLHYALGLGAIGRPAWLVWPMLVVDAGVVALFAHCLAGSSFVAARHAARRRGVSLDGGAAWPVVVASDGAMVPAR